MGLANPVHPWSEQRKLVEKLRPDRQNQSAHLDPRPPGVAHRRCGPSRRQGRHVDGSLLAGQVELDEMTEPRKTGVHHLPPGHDRAPIAGNTFPAVAAGG